MTLGFVETRLFMSVRDEYFAGDASYSALQQALLKDPAAGAVIPGSGGLRKIRWPDPRRGKGKRGGLRVIYLHVSEAQIILFVRVYDKDDTNDLTADERKALALFAAEYRSAALERR